MKWRLNESADRVFSGLMVLVSCCVLALFVFIGSLRSNTVCHVLCSWPIGSCCCRLHAISLNFAREKSIFLSQTLIFKAVVCLLVLNVLIFLSSQPLERRCSLTKGVSYFLLIFSFSLKWNLATKLISINFFFSTFKTRNFFNMKNPWQKGLRTRVNRGPN